MKYSFIKPALIASAALLITPVADAAVYSAVGSGNWDDTSKWNMGITPNPEQDDITIGSGFSILAINVPPNGFNSVAQTNGHTILINGAGSKLTSHDYVISNGASTTVSNGAVLNLTGYLFGGNFGAASSLNIDGGVVYQASTPYQDPSPVRSYGGAQIGLVSDFTVNITNGGQFLKYSLENGWVKIGMNSGVTGTISIDGSGSLFSRDYADPDTNRVENIVVGEVNGATGNVYLKNGGALTDNMNLVIAQNGGSNGNVIVGGDNSGAAGTGILTISKNIILGDGNATFLQHDGITTTGVAGVGGTFRVGVGNGSVAVTTINGGTMNVGGELSIAQNGGSTGTVNLNGGTTSVDYVIIGSGTGALNFNGGILKANKDENNFLQNITSSNSEIQSGGAIFDSNNHNIEIGSSLDGTGGLTKQGAGTLILSAANSYGGVTTISSGALNPQNSGALGSTTAGTVVSSGAALQLQGGITISDEALTISGMGEANDGALRSISGNNSYNGNITLGSNTRINSEAVGETLTINPSGGNAISGAFDLTLGGSGNIQIGDPITNGGNLIKDGAGTLTLDSTNTYTGGTLINDGILRIGGGPGNTNAIPDLSAVNIATGALLDLNNNNETIGSLTGAGNVTLGSGTLTTGGNNGSTTFSGVISSTTGGLVKEGTGTLTLEGMNTYGGTTTINNGTLLVNGGVTSDINVGATGTLGGNGTMSGNVILNGALDTAGIISSMNIGGNLTLAGSSVINMELGGSNPGEYDHLTLSLGFTMSGTLNVTLINGFTPVPGNFFNLLDFDTMNTSGSFSAINLPALGPGFAWDTSSFYSNGGFTVVPEPSAIGLLAFSSILILKRRK